MRKSTRMACGGDRMGGPRQSRRATAVAAFCGKVLYGCETLWITQRHLRQLEGLIATAMERTKDSQAAGPFLLHFRGGQYEPGAGSRRPPPWTSPLVFGSNAVTPPNGDLLTTAWGMVPPWPAARSGRGDLAACADSYNARDARPALALSGGTCGHQQHNA